MTACPKQSLPAVKAGVYTRISSDPSGQRAGVDRQRADCEAHCLARGWEVVEVFCDNDASAYGRKPRRAYERMLAAVESGSIDAIVTWHNDRLHRSPKELEAFIDLVERSRVHLAVVTGGDYDLTTPDGRLSARIVGAVARKESEDKSRRVRRKHLELAELGRPAGQLGWGVRSEDEREYVREAARRVLKGDGLMTIARDWNTEGVPGASGGPWTAPTLRRVLLSSRIAGLREHGVDPSGKALGDLSPAVWAAALDRQTWDQLRAVLLNPERNISVRRATRYLLTGLIHCGAVAQPCSPGRATTTGATCSTTTSTSGGCWPRAGTGRSGSSWSGRSTASTPWSTPGPSSASSCTPPDPRAFWAEADFQQRRDLVRLMIERVEVMPGRSAVRRFDASRLRIRVHIATTDTCR